MVPFIAFWLFWSFVDLHGISPCSSTFKVSPCGFLGFFLSITPSSALPPPPQCPMLAPLNSGLSPQVFKTVVFYSNVPSCLMVQKLFPGRKLDNYKVSFLSVSTGLCCLWPNVRKQFCFFKFVFASYGVSAVCPCVSIMTRSSFFMAVLRSPLWMLFSFTIYV